jgi:hypothetical protein
MNMDASLMVYCAFLILHLQVGIDVSDDEQPAAKAPRKADSKREKHAKETSKGGSHEEDAQTVAQAHKLAQEVCAPVCWCPCARL